jgi:putative SOS response-associated peptidase YedK
MCGRFSLTNTAGLDERFDAEYPDEDIRPRYNIAPSQYTLIIPQEHPHKMELAQWGFPLSWIKDRPEGLINIRAETLRDKPSFKKYLKEGRCLVIADGFYEWRKEKDSKTPYRITLKKVAPFAMAGLYRKKEEKLHFAIITTAPNTIMEPIHNRMPVILEKKEEMDWLEGETKLALKDILSPYPASHMETYAVSRLVNSPRNDSEQVLKRA